MNVYCPTSERWRISRIRIDLQICSRCAVQLTHPKFVSSRSDPSGRASRELGLSVSLRHDSSARGARLFGLYGMAALSRGTPGRFRVPVRLCCEGSSTSGRFCCSYSLSMFDSSGSCAESDTSSLPRCDIMQCGPRR